MEDRLCPSSGSSLVPVGSGPGYQLSVNSFARFASLQISQTEYDRWAVGSQSGADAQTMARRVYDHLGDDYDFLVFINRQQTAPANAGYFGLTYTARSDAGGIGRAPFNNSAAYGSAGNLNGVIHLIEADGLTGGPSLHEFMHQWGNYLPEVNGNLDSHWGFAGVGGQLGGWQPGTLRSLGGNRYDADGPLGDPGFGTVANGGNSIPYGALELYLMGLVDRSAVPPIQVARNAAFTDPANGAFTADRIDTVSIDDVIAAEGARTPSVATSQKSFHALVVVLAPTALSQQEIDYFDTAVQNFTRAGDDGSPLYNFWEATGGRATMQMDNVAAPGIGPTPPDGGGGGSAPGGPSRHLIAVGAGVGVSAHVKAIDAATGAERLSFFAYDNTQTGVRVGVGDVNGDGFDDVITGTTPGPAGGHVRVFDGKTGALLYSFLSMPGFTGGIYVAIGDVNGDGAGDLIVSADNGDLNGDGVSDVPQMAPQFAGGHVMVFDGRTLAVLRDFRAFDMAFLGGARVGSGDVDGDGTADVIVGSGFGSTPHVKVFSGTDNSLIRSFFAYASSFRGGVFVSGGDVDGDGTDEVVTEAGGIPHVKAFGPASFLQPLNAEGTPNPVVSFIATNPGGAPISGGPIAAFAAGSGRALLALAVTLSPSSLVREVDPLDQAVLAEFAPFPGFRGTVSVG
jgi:hypothetical protein